eukprot:GFYU01000978.1.p1 GENE.GFYU01000978.1~~GFYU01000978.1.p1  ORF type:complete len:550 (+),score=176.84 GFYU01000978.1:172-1821(+)
MSAQGILGDSAGVNLQAFVSTKAKLDELFLHWLSAPETQAFITSMLKDIKEGRPLSAPPPNLLHLRGDSFGAQPISPPPPRSPTMHSPSSPRSLAESPRSQSTSPSARRRPVPSEEHKQERTPIQTTPAASIPQFFFPKKPRTQADKDEDMKMIQAAFNTNPDGFKVDEFIPITKFTCQFPAFFNVPLFTRIDTNKTGVVTLQSFTEWWKKNMEEADLETRYFNLLKTPENNAIIPADFKPYMQELLAYHPGLEFLEATPEFQERYAETVIVRIFYTLNRKKDGKISLRELKKSNLVEVLKLLDEEQDINKITHYFSYEHFYVIYCKFWELDTDHDFYIDKEDLLRYANHSLTYRVVDRIFEQAPLKFTSDVEGKMNYEDFIWFLLSEEDKTSDTSLEYWFRCVDLDGDGYITTYEMDYFYQEQLHRMECLSQELIAFEDVVCQMLDMIKPTDKRLVSLNDLKRCKMGGSFFNVLFNLNKFIAFEQRDPFLIRQEQNSPELTEWDRFAHAEYIRLAMEDEGGEDGMSDSDGWENFSSGSSVGHTSEAPF